VSISNYRFAQLRKAKTRIARTLEARGETHVPRRCGSLRTANRRIAARIGCSGRGIRQLRRGESWLIWNPPIAPISRFSTRRRQSAPYFPSAAGVDRACRGRVIGNLILSTLVRCKHGRGSFDARAAFVCLYGAALAIRRQNRRDHRRVITASRALISHSERRIRRYRARGSRKLLSSRRDCFAKQRYAE